MTDALLPQPKRVRLDGPPVLNSNECITFHLLKRVDGAVVMEEDGHFPPEMTHQLFDEEEIKGYDGLEIDVFFTPSFQVLIDVKYVSRIDKGATNLAEPFKKTFSAGFFETKTDFDRAFEQEPPIDAATLGQVIYEADTQEDTTFKVFRCNLSTASEAVRTLHARIQPLLLFFVDAASAIDASDPAWELLLAVEVSKDGSIEVMGFSTVYNFYVFPDRRRLRLSQILVLPPHQGRGVGGLLVDAVYKMAEEANAVDITLEDPTDDLRRLRDRKDLRNMVGADWLRTEAKSRLDALLGDKGKGSAEATADATAAVTSPLAASPDTLTKLQKEMRLSKQQARRMWENLLYAVAAESGDAQAVAAVEGMVAATLEAQVAGAKEGSQGKSMVDTASGFVMFKSKRVMKAAAPGAVPVEGVSAEQTREAIQEAVALRVDEMRRLIGIKGGEGDEDEEDGNA